MTDIANIKIGETEQGFVLNQKQFKTGSRGYHGQGKMSIGEKKYQINILVVEIGSKPKE